MATSTLLCLLLAVWVDESTTTVQDQRVPSDTEDWTEHVNRIQDYSTQTAPGVCQLSTCEFLLRELGATEQKIIHMEEEMRTMREMIQELLTMKTKVTDIEDVLQGSQTDIEQLKREHGVKVAFFASLTGRGAHTGPYNAPTPLVYRKIITNIGNAYNPGLGIFTAPVKGVYFFSLYYHAATTNNARLFLQKNGQTIASTSHHKIDLGSANGSNGATVELKPGDHVNVVLYPHGWVWDSANHDTTFNGYLVYQLP